MYTVNNVPLTRDSLHLLLASIDSARICLIGDLCLDLYWTADMTLSELSRETPHYPLPIVDERYTPGGAGNVICNLAALNPQRLLTIGVVGNDWRGDMLLQALEENSVNCKYIIRDDTRVTNTYIKPMRFGISDVVYEDPRLDFEARSPLSVETEEKLIAALDDVTAEVDVICVSDQMTFGCITPAVRNKLCMLGKAGKTVIVDSRDHVADYKYVTIKPNEVEVSRAFADGTEISLEALSALANKITAHTARDALITLGSRGCFVIHENKVTQCTAYPVKPPIDFCGAGDTFLAGYGALIAGGADPVQAAQVANLCAAVTIKKVGTTGTASRNEVIQAWDLYNNIK